MKEVLLCSLLFAIALTGCTSHSLHGPAETPPAPLTLTTAVPSTSSRVNLPYLFVRHGVQVRINSVEYAGTQILVNITLQETRDNAVDLQASTLMEVASSAGKPVPFIQYTRGEKTQPDSTLHLEPHDQFSATLFYQPAPEGPLELKFPTGRYWSSI